jgi:hypothetical protein
MSVEPDPGARGRSQSSSAGRSPTPVRNGIAARIAAFLLDPIDRGAGGARASRVGGEVPPVPTSARASGSETRKDAVFALLALTALLGLFLSTPLARFGSGYYSPADVTQGFSLTRVEDGHVPGNDLLSDLVVEMEPWRVFSREELARGRLPLINPYNGGGIPLFANYQSAVLSPFRLPYYFLPLRAALIASAFLKLFALGFFTFFFLRLLALSRASALIGATAFAFAGHNVLLLGYPHAAAVVVLPAGLYFAERMLQRFERHAGAPSGGRTLTRAAVLDVVGFGIVLVSGLLSGHPEALFFATALVALWIVARLFRVWRRTGGDAHALSSIAPLILRFASAAALAAGLTAIQTIPFLEYLRESQLVVERSAAQTPLHKLIWPLAFFPNLLGNPSTGYQLTNNVPPPNFETANLMYVGCVALLLAAIAVPLARKSRPVAFFALVAVIWFLYAHGLFGIEKLAEHVPLLGLAPLNRSQPIWILCIAALAAFGFESVLRYERKRRLVAALGVLAFAALSFAVFHEGAAFVLGQARRKLRDSPHADMLGTEAPAHIAYIGIVFAAGALCIAALFVVRHRLARSLLVALVIAAVFVPSGWLLRDYMPVTEDRFFFPQTPAIEALQREVGRSSFGVLGPDTIPPETNMIYGLSMPASYDALWIRRYDELYQEIFGGRDNWRRWTRASRAGLELFGVERVLSKGAWPEIDTAFPDVPFNPLTYFEVGDILPGRDVVQTFTLLDDRLVALRVPIGARPAACTLDIALEDVADGRVIASQRIDCSRIEVEEDGMHDVVLAFTPSVTGENAYGRELRLRLSSSDARPGEAACTWRRNDHKHWENLALLRARARRALEKPEEQAVHPDLERWRLTFAGETLKGGLAFDCSASLHELEKTREIGPFNVYRLKKGAPRFRAVQRAVHVAHEQDSFRAVLHPRFDPLRMVVLVGEHASDERAALLAGLGAGDNVPAAVDVVSDEPTSVRVRTHLAERGWLTTARPWYPGWTAHVNGRHAPIVRVNYAFLGLELPPGECDIELRYEPESVLAGAWISLASLVVAAAWMFVRLRGSSSLGA